MDVFEQCPEFSCGHFLLRQTRIEDRDNLLKVYSDRKAWPIFNADNCTGDFYMTKPEDMGNCIDFWLSEYRLRYYVRWSIIHRKSGCAVGTIEMFHRTSDDFYNHAGLLRLDLRSDFETAPVITEIAELILPPFFQLFHCSIIATKIPPCAQVRKDALCAMGFRYASALLRGHDGTCYGDYYILEKPLND